MEIRKSQTESLSAFFTDHYVYQTYESVGTIRTRIKYVIDQKGVFEFEYNLCGHLTANHSFVLNRRFGFLVIKSWDRDPVTIKGKLIETASNLTEIEVFFKPNFIFLLFSVFFTAMSIFFLFSGIAKHQSQLLVGIGFLFVPLIMYFGACKTKKYHKSEFEKALGLASNHTVVARSIKF